MNQQNFIKFLKNAIVAYADEVGEACGVKKIDDESLCVTIGEEDGTVFNVYATMEEENAEDEEDENDEEE